MALVSFSFVGFIQEKGVRRAIQSFFLEISASLHKQVLT